MNMKLDDTIYKRKTTRSYDMTPLSKEILEDINAFTTQIKPLDASIKTCCEIIGTESVKCILPWKSLHYIDIFSEEKDGYALNVGFLYQQLDLYLQSKGLWCCWLGLGKFVPSEENASDFFTDNLAKPTDSSLHFVIMIAFGKAKGEAQRNLSGFRRKALSEITDKTDERLEPARLAPSGKNIQPWYFIHDGNIIHTYYVPQGIFKAKEPSKINLIDIGCALAQMYVSNPDIFQFFITERSNAIAGYYYIGSLKI